MAKTELSERKQAVLAAIVKAYIETGEPVGSKVLTELLENAPSSATIRNEMNDLCVLGLLEQPHTSAGRIPTSSGYRFYLEALMKPRKLGTGTTSYLDSVFSAAQRDPQSIPMLAGRTVFELTGFPAIVTSETDSNVYVKRVELLRVGKTTAALLLITSDGRTQNRICHLQQPLTDELSSRFTEIVNSRIKHHSLVSFNRATLQNIIASSGFDSFALMPLVTSVFEMSEKLSEPSVRIVGTPQLYNICGGESARKLLSLTERSETMISVLGNKEEGANVVFGNDTGFSELKNLAIVSAGYKSGGRYAGKIGVIGPGRMSYDEVLPSIEYIAAKLSELLTEAVKDMED